MAENFYAQWFSRTQPKPLTPQEKWERHTSYLRELSQSEFGQGLAERFDVPEVEAAEAAFKAALQEISDPETRNKLDMAAGKISYAYQILASAPDTFRRTVGRVLFRLICDNLRGVTRHYSCIPHIAVHKDYRCRVIAADIITALFESTEADSLQILHVDRSRQQ